jgi:16S rRNA (guanine527-N7)-methyltransferase
LGTLVSGQAALAALAERLDVPVSPSQWRALDQFVGLLLEWNARINLTGARSREEVMGEHVPDALALAHLVPGPARVIDVGSGGGLPALPFAILRGDCPLTLVEPRAKRVAFLRTAVRQAGLEKVEVRAGRVEEVGNGMFDVAASRATFPPAEWLDRASALAPRAVVFAAHQRDVAAGGRRLEAWQEYATAAGHPRWAGRFCST